MTLAFAFVATLLAGILAVAATTYATRALVDEESLRKSRVSETSDDDPRE